MDGGDVVLFLAKLVLEIVDPALRVPEHEHLIGLIPAEKLLERADLVLLEHFHLDLVDAVDVLLLRLDSDLDRVVAEPPGELTHVCNKRGTEEGGLAPFRRAPEQPPHLWCEAHVQEAVGLVEHDNEQTAQIEISLLDVVEQAAWRADDDLGAARESALLWTVGNAAIDRDFVRFAVLADRAELPCHLECELARRDHDESLRPLQRRFDLFEDGDRERGGLAGAGLRLGKQVAARLQDRDRPRLYGRRRHEAKLVYGAGNVGVDRELAEASGRWCEGQCLSGFDLHANR